MMASGKTFQNNNEYDEIVNLLGVRVPGDLIVEILLKLPVKSLIRFKAVCKAWKLLINSLVFTNKHLHMQSPQHGLFPVLEEDTSNSFPCKIDYSVGSCNGIICFKTTNYQTPLALYNPTTREFSFLPEECSGYFYGFCYVSQTQEYKVISINWLSSDGSNVDMRIMTLMMKTKSFRDVKGIMLPGRITYGVANLANCGSNIVWLGYDDDFSCLDNDAIVICYYDAYEDKFSKTNAPPSTLGPFEIQRSLTVIEDSVIMFVHSQWEMTSFDIWILRDIGSKDKRWMKYQTVKPLATWETIHPVHACSDIRWVLCSMNDENFANWHSSDLFYYNVETDQVEDYKATDPDIVVKEFVNYVESLVSPITLCSMD